MTMNPSGKSAVKKACVVCGKQFLGGDACPHDGGLLAPIKDDPIIGTVLDNRYLILDIIGGGGMGVVYRARHQLMKRIVAIKMLHKNLVSTGDALRRFQLEAQASSCLSLPNILTVYDFGVSPDGQPYMVMDYLDGYSLADLLENEGHLSVERTLNIFVQACAALSHAHEKGVLHRDIKPSNIMLVKFEEERDFVKIVDFGIAKLMSQNDSTQLTKTGEVFGSPLYMSPEQCRGKALDVRSDIYSMGCVLYKTLSGAPIFVGEELIELIFKQMSETPLPFKTVCPQFKIPAELEEIVLKAVAKDPEHRFQTMDEFRAALRKLQKTLLNTAEPTLPPMMEGLRQNAFMEAMVAVVHPSVIEATPHGFTGANSHLAFSEQPALEAPSELPLPPKRTYNGIRSSRFLESGLDGDQDPDQTAIPKKQKSAMTLYMVLGGVLSFILCMSTFIYFQNAKGHMYDSSVFSAKLAKSQDDLRSGHYQDALNNATQAVDEASKLGTSDPQLANALFVRAKANYALSKNDLSKADALRALDMRRSISGDRSWPTAEATVALAKTLITEGNFKDAEPMLAEAVTIENSFQGKELDRADAVYTLGVCHEHLGRSQDAANEVGQALAIEQKVLKADDLSLAVTQATYNRLALQASSQIPASQTEVSASEEIKPAVAAIQATEPAKVIAHNRSVHHASHVPAAVQRRAYSFGR
jgi:eukaryotic-like serine/threonine-protein kinase